MYLYVESVRVRYMVIGMGSVEDTIGARLVQGTFRSCQIIGGEIPECTGSAPGNSTRKILVCRLSICRIAVGRGSPHDICQTWRTSARLEVTSRQTYMKQSISSNHDPILLCFTCHTFATNMPCIFAVRLEYGESQHFCDGPVCPDSVWKLSIRIWISEGLGDGE